MHGKMKKGSHSLPVPQALILMFGKPGGDKREKKMNYKNKKRKKDYEDEEEEEE